MDVCSVPLPPSVPAEILSSGGVSPSLAGEGGEVTPGQGKKQFGAC